MVRGDAICIFVSVSENFTPEIPAGRRVELFGLLKVKVIVEVPPEAIAVALNDFVIVGFWMTRIFAVASSGF